MTQRDITTGQGRDQHELTGLEIAIVGMAGRFPGARNIHEFWENLKNGKESITFFSDKELAEAGVESQLINNPNYVKAMSILADKEYFDAYFFGYTPAEAEVMAPQVRIYHECAWAALEDAGYNPHSYNGMIGCYAGSSSSFEWQAFTFITGMNRRLGIWESHLLSAKDNLATHLAYKLDLKGPDFTFFSACSTSLVAVHLACRAILTGECSMALAGGIALDTIGKPGYLYQEGMIVSPDGHCRSFDAAANGTIFGEGVGVVVLKRLRDAVNDGDHIYAAVKGSAVNNDGIGKVGYTAPGARGQRDVVKQALKAAKVPAESISYIETHGTATALGDPVEIAALQEAFNTDKKQFCAIGSVKTNIGHLDAAAGIAGFIKTVLTLKHRLIPPSLHYHTPNPQIDFDHSPFYVNAQLKEWKNETGSLRAGVSSFGIGGTNAHVIVEEYKIASGDQGAFLKNRPLDPQKTSHYLILLSAKTQSVLEKMTENLANYLEKNPGLNPAHIAYTLQAGRRTFRHRRMTVSSSVEAIIQALTLPNDPNNNKVKTFSTAGENQDPPLVFMFPGLGSQYTGMGLDLYKTIPLFRKEMDHCFEILQSLTGYNFKAILYPSLEEHSSNESDRTNIIDRVEFAQPIIFIFEYALVKLIMSWGIIPQAMIGYSFGEYTAACAAGVFSLEDALQLVVSRGKLIQKAPPGAMLSVPLPRQEVAPLLAQQTKPELQLSLAIDNGPSCIVAGTPAAVEVFEKELKEKKILCMRAPGSQALHTPMMAAIGDEFRQAAASLRFNIPQIPYISNVTGNWIHGQQAVDPAYWATHLQQTVQFGDGVKLLANKWQDVIFVEVGPGSDLSALAARYIDQTSQQRILHLVRRPQREIADDYFLLDKIGRLWLYGVKPDWQAFHAHEKKQRIPLPTYPFDRHYYPAHGDPYALGMKRLSPQPLLEHLEKKNDAADWFYLPTWKRTMPLSANKLLQSDSVCWLILGNPGGLGTRLAQQLTHLTSGKQEAIISGEDEFDPRRPAAYDAILANFKKQGKIPGKIIHLWGLNHQSKEKEAHGETKIEAFDAAQDLGLYSLVNLAKAIHNLDHGNNFEIIVISNGLHEVTGAETLYPEKSTILAAVKTIPQEYPYISCRNIDIPIPEQGSWREKKLIDRLVVEISVPSASAETIIAYRDDYRWAQVYEPVRLEEVPVGSNIPRLKQGGVYLVTGGLGGMGLTLAGYLAREVQARLILTGRSFMPPRPEWEQWLSGHKEDDHVSNKIQKIKELEKVGAEVLVFSVDVADREEMARAMAQAEEQFGPINGVVHAAGILGGALSSFNIIGKLDETAFKEQFRPKVYGLLALAEILADKPVDFCILTSSLSPILGGLGFTAYSAANQYMDAFVYKHNRDHCRDNPCWISLNWGDWQPWNPADRQTIIGATINRLNMSPVEGIETFRRILFHCGAGQIVVSSGDLQVRLDQWIRLKTVREQDKSTPGTVSATVQRLSHLSDSYEAPRDQIEKKLAEIWQRLFGFDRIGIQDDFFELGGDSLKAITLAARIHKELHSEIPLTAFFENPTIAKLARYIHVNAASGTRGYETIEPVEKKEYYPLSSAQKRLYIIQQMQKEFTGYNDQMAFVLEGVLAKEKLEQAFRKLIQRHESLRTSFEMGANEPIQKVHDCVEFEILNFGRGVLPEAPNLIKNFIRPFDLSRPPLLRVGLVNIGENKHILMFDMHHIVFDGTSMGILLNEVAMLYAGEELPALTIQYKDFSTWHNRLLETGKIKAQEEFWLNLYADYRIAGDIPSLNLPADYPRPQVMHFEGDTYEFSLGAENTLHLKALAVDIDATLYMNLLAILNVLLYRYTGQEDIIVGSAIAGRPYENLQPIIGMFVNTLALRNWPVGEKTYLEFLKEVKSANMKAYENQDLAFDDLVDKLNLERDPSRNPLFDICLAFQNFEQLPVKLEDIEASPYHLKNKTSRFDMTLFAWEVGEEIVIGVEYYTGLFKAETMQRFGSHLVNVAAAVIKNPNVRLREIEILTEEEKQVLIYAFNNTDVPYPREKTLHELFESQVERMPDRIAVFGHGLTRTTLSYNGLNEQSARLAQVLTEKGILADDIIGIMIERSVEMIIGILGILKSGGGYLSVNPDYPQDRIEYMLKDSGTKILIVKSEIRISKFETNLYDQNTNDQNKNLGIPFVLNFENLNFEFVSSFGFRASDLIPSNLAYIVYTSGSTGKPKGVMVEHRNVVRLVKNTNYVEFKEHDRLLPTGALEFDASTFEIWGALLNGMTLCLVPKEDILIPEQLKLHIRRYDICTIWLTSPLFNQLARMDVEIFGGLRNLLVGGDVLSPQDIGMVMERFTGLNVINGYGPTENTTFSTTYRVDRQYELRIPIGSPIANSTAYIVDRAGHLASVGIAGELWVGGDGVSRGYLNNPELTEEKFMKSLSGSAYRRGRFFKKAPLLYRTGDLARWLVAGDIEFLGRIDQQVKIRGSRVELREIESLLSKHELVKLAVVIDREERSGEKYLCGYIVAKQEFDLAELKEYLSHSLPDYMIPSYFMRLESIPLTVNGKVDRKALPAPEIKTSKKYEAPANQIEEKLAEVWSEVLAIEKAKISRNDNFFQLGGHSLKATILTAKIHKFFDVKIPLTQIFLLPTIRELGQYIKESVEDKYLAVEPVEKQEYYVLSSAQQRLYILQQMDVGGTSYHVPNAYMVEGELDMIRLDMVFRKLIQRHESLRTSFIVVNEEPVQKVHDEVEFKIEVLEGRDQGASVSNFIRPFELSHAPLMRVGVIKETKTRHILVVDIHHIVTDGTSMELLIKEFKLHYMGQELPPLYLQYKDYARWQSRGEQKEAILRQEAYWLEQFSGEIPILELPTDFPRPVVQSFEGHSLSFEIAAPGMKGLKKIAVQQEVTLYMVLQAITTIFIAKLTNQEDIIIGTPMAGRRHADLERIIGMFVNTLAIRSFPVGEKLFTEFLGEVKARTLAAFENQDYQFEDLVERVLANRDMGRNPLFDVVFVLQNLDVQGGSIPDVNITGLIVKPYASEIQTAKFDITLSCFEGNEGLFFTLEYCTKLFKEETIERFIHYFRNIIFAVTAKPEVKIADIEIISEEEKQRILEDFNDTETSFPADKTIHEIFENQVERTPDRIAVFGHGRTRTNTDNPVGAESNSAPSFRHINMSYRQLNEQSGRLAELLIERGVLADDIVGIMMERSVEMIIGILGILKSGGAYLPIDPDYPQERIDYMLRDSGAKLLAFANAQEGEKVRRWEGKKVLLEEILKSPKISSYPLTVLPSYPLNSSNLAYIIYTSGSTGKPKGTLTTHANVVRVVKNTNYIELTANDRVLQLSNYAFDGSVFDIYGALLNQAVLVLVDRERLLAVEFLAELIKQEQVTVFFVTTALFNTLVDVEIGCFANVRKVLFGGERVSVEHSRKALAYLGKGRIIHVYGPTETTVYATYYFINDIEDKAITIPIGKPISNTTVYIFTQRFQPAPMGVSGELYIGGAGVARGYLNNPELTKEKFIRSFAGVKGGLFQKPPLVDYRTGDLARWLITGDIEFMGRIDQQVKIRGFRIELGEIETELLKHDLVKEVVVIDKLSDTGEKYLCGYIVPEEEFELTVLKEFLSKRLPDYMVPSYIEGIESIPLNPNGKVDRKALPEPEIKRSKEYEGPANEIEEKLVEVWSEVLGIEKGKISINVNFFDLGGHSLKAMVMIAKIHKLLNQKLEIMQIFQAPTIRGIASLIQAIQWVNDSEQISDITGEHEGEEIVL